MLLHSLVLANFGSFFGLDGFVVLVLGLLVFGRKLPEVGKNLGKTIVEFKKGLNGSYSGDDQAAEEEAPAAPPRRLSSGGNRISAAPSRSRRLSSPERESEEV
jgi:sec-independent protein translocase protein TatA